MSSCVPEFLTCFKYTATRPSHRLSRHGHHHHHRHHSATERCLHAPRFMRPEASFRQSLSEPIIVCLVKQGRQRHSQPVNVDQEKKQSRTDFYIIRYFLRDFLRTKCLIRSSQRFIIRSQFFNASPSRNCKICAVFIIIIIIYALRTRQGHYIRDWVKRRKSRQSHI